MIRPSTISHVTSEWEDQCAWLDARIEEQSARDYDELDRGGLVRMAKERGEDKC